MKIIVLHEGPRELSLAMTSLITGLRKKYRPNQITWVTNVENLVFFRHQKDVTPLTVDDRIPDQEYDLVVNYGGSADLFALSSRLRARKFLGLYGEESTFSSDNASDAQHVYQVLYENKTTKQNVFQIVYQMADLVWRGESYAVKYFPRRKAREGHTGLAVRNQTVRQFLRTRLEADGEVMLHVPVKQDPLKQFDEVNVCENVITDDPFVMHVAVALRKHVEFLLYDIPPTRLEFFGNGFCHFVPEILRGPVPVLP